MDKFDEGIKPWEDPEIKQWLMQNRDKGCRPEASLGENEK
jgi:hypothetical protein